MQDRTGGAAGWTWYSSDTLEDARRSKREHRHKARREEYEQCDSAVYDAELYLASVPILKNHVHDRWCIISLLQLLHHSTK